MASATARMMSRSHSSSRAPMDVATSSRSRHSSAGARETSREPRRTRTREASEHGASLRAEPVGPEEVNDWLEALNLTTNRFSTLEMLARSHAQLLSDADVRLVDIRGRLNDYSNKLDKLNTKSC